MNNVRTFVVTGASGGIGGAVAEALATRGYHLVLSGRDGTRLAALASRLPAAADAVWVASDLATADGRAALVTACADTGGADGLVNVAGVGCFAAFERMDDDMIAAVVTANLTATMQLTRALLPQLLARGRADLVNIGSTFGSLAFPGHAAYSASKFGLYGFSEALRREFADRGLCVHHIAPRATDTALNSAAVNALNAAMGNHNDAPTVVAQAVLAALDGGRGGRHYLGWPEALFARLNLACPALVDKALAGKLALIRRHLP